MSRLKTLQYIHDKGIIHRDIKPENIIIRSSDGLPVLIDFGAVKNSMGKLQLKSGSTISSVIIGTRGFMAPEQSQGCAIFSSDLYSLGRTIIYALTGKLPIEMETNPRTGELDWKKYVPILDSKLAHVLNKANQLSPERRYSTAEEMYKDLNFDSQVKTQVVTPNSKEIPTVISSESKKKSSSTNSPTFVSPKNITNSVWKWLIGGIISSATVGAGIFVASQWVIYDNAEKLIQEARNNYEQNKHQDCYSTAKDAINESQKLIVFGQDLFHEANDFKNKCQRASDNGWLAHAQSLFNQAKGEKDYIEAIKKAREVSKYDNNLYQKAQTIIDDSVNKIIKIAETEYDSSGNSNEVSKIVQPLIEIFSQNKNNQFYKKVKSKIQDWESDEKSNRVQLKKAQEQLDKTNWSQVLHIVDDLLTTTYHKNLAKLIRQQAVEELDNLESKIDVFMKHYFTDINEERWEDAWNHQTTNFQTTKVKYDTLEGFISECQGKQVDVQTIDIQKTKPQLTEVKVTYNVRDQVNNTETPKTKVYCLREDYWYNFKLETNNFCQ